MQLRVGLGLCLLVLLAPVVPWLLAVVFSGIDRSWLDAPGALVFTVPVGLALGALVLVGHGLLVQELIVDEIALVTAGELPARSTGTALADASEQGTDVVVPHREGGEMVPLDEPTDDASEPGMGSKAGAAATSMAKRQLVRQQGRLKWRARSRARSEARRLMRDLRS